MTFMTTKPRAAVNAIRQTVPIPTAGSISQTPSQLAMTCRLCRRNLFTASQSPYCQQQPQLPQPPRTTHQPFRRNITTTPSTRQHTKPTPQTESIRPQTHYDFFPSTLSLGPPPHGPFDLNPRTLRTEFLKLQASAHPDLHPGPLKPRAEALSSRINEAYKTLLDPLKRAQYILSLHGVEAEDEAGKMGDEVGDMETLAVVMEAREAIEEAERESDLEGLKGENEERIAEGVERLGGLLESGQWEEAKREAVKLKFWYNIREGIEGWTEGGGVPNLVH